MGKAKPKAQSKELDREKAGGNKKRRRREVQIVSCPSDFPISSRNATTKLPSNSSQKQASPSGEQQQQESYRGGNKPKNLLDWSDTAKEIRSFGATGFEGQQKRNFEDEQYELLTGRKKKKQHVPLPIVRGIKKKAEERRARQIKEAKEAGTVLPKSLTQKKKTRGADNTTRVHGPAPSVGFMKKGVLRVKPSWVVRTQ